MAYLNLFLEAVMFVSLLPQRGASAHTYIFALHVTVATENPLEKQ